MSSPAPPLCSSSSTASPIKTWHRANCHCGTVRYHVFLPALAGVANPHPVMSCNCSLCTRNGYLNVYPQRHEMLVQIHHHHDIPGEESSQVLLPESVPGSETLRSATEEILGYYHVYGGALGRENEHVFCKLCGSSLWVDAKGGEEMAKQTRKEGEEDIVAVNVRMFQDINVQDLKLQFANGRTWDPQYKI
ncbi:hypothetical protein MMC29_005477 [Sticta canariensis]|nr:hypothetical protein [Sticta canariensis]